MKFRRITSSDLPELNEFWIEHWGGPEMVVHGVVFRTDQLDGFVAEGQGGWVGLVTFLISETGCEIISLNSLKEGRGIAGRLIEKVVDAAKERKCRRVFLSTTNDNLHALGFYQKCGFELAVLRRGAVNESRRIKPSIPLIGANNIPLRDEIELEMLL
ncbi:MAG: GNAT family N-acetyltransferase [Chloroflexi bacterium]|nr:GNAT family N-acetyltransferase [Chloroflexota bacterium]